MRTAPRRELLETPLRETGSPVPEASEETEAPATIAESGAAKSNSSGCRASLLGWATTLPGVPAARRSQRPPRFPDDLGDQKRGGAPVSKLVIKDSRRAAFVHRPGK